MKRVLGRIYAYSVAAKDGRISHQEAIAMIVKALEPILRKQ